eukprot:1925746-Prymnesium_polylepis.1
MPAGKVGGAPTPNGATRCAAKMLQVTHCPFGKVLQPQHVRVHVHAPVIIAHEMRPARYWARAVERDTLPRSADQDDAAAANNTQPRLHGEKGVGHVFDHMGRDQEAAAGTRYLAEHIPIVKQLNARDRLVAQFWVQGVQLRRSNLVNIEHAVARAVWYWRWMVQRTHLQATNVFTVGASIANQMLEVERGQTGCGH